MFSIFKRKFELKTKLYLISIGMVLFFGVVVSFQFLQGVKDQKKSKLHNTTLYLDNLNGTVSELFFAHYNNIVAFARNQAFSEDGHEDKNTMDFVLNELVTLFPYLDYISLVDLEGNLLSTSTINSKGKNLNAKFMATEDFKKYDWYQDIIDKKYVEDFKKGIFGGYVSEIRSDEIAKKMYGDERRGQFFGNLIEDDMGDPVAVLVGFSGIRWVENELASLHHSLSSNGMKSAEIYLVDGKGKILTSYKTKQGGKKPEFVREYKKSLFDSNREFIKQLKDKKKTALVDKDLFDEGKETLYAFGPIKNKRFLDQMNWSLVMGLNPAEAFSEILDLQKLFFSTIAIMLVICIVVSIFIVGNLNKQLMQVIAGLRSSADRTYKFVSELNGMSSKVNDMSSSQASAIQETASTLDEVSQMVKMSADNAGKSVGISSEAESNANSGRKIVDQVLEAMNDIKGSNEEILETTAEGNRKINEIVSVIDAISEKTKVINDIVFQTKLLSFNASVESARAGEHGKGFAVVAEEVGNLAQMSGKAAEEISQILGESVQKVEKIVVENQSAIEKIMDKSKETIEEGIRISGECTIALGEIVDGVKVVNQMSNEISSATKEQDIGISNITEAMNMLRDGTNENTRIASQTLNCSKDLDHETNYLKDVITTLELEITGGVAKKSVKSDNDDQPKGLAQSKKQSNIDSDTVKAESVKEKVAKEKPVKAQVKEENNVIELSSTSKGKKSVATDNGEWEDMHPDMAKTANSDFENI